MIFCLVALPMIVRISSTPNPREGNQLIIECRVSGIPLPTVVWMKDGGALSNNETIDRIFVSMSSEGVSRISISSSIVEDSGVYTCTARNPAGSASNMIRVQVNDGKYNLITIAWDLIANGLKNFILNRQEGGMPCS